MKLARKVAVIFTLIILILPMIITPVKAESLGTIYNFTSEMKGNTVYFTWSKVSGVDGYDLWINTSNKGFEYIGQTTNTTVGVIGFETGKTYTAKIYSYEYINGQKQYTKVSSIINVNTTPSESLASVQNLTVSQNGGIISLNYSKVSNATGYQIFADLGYGYFLVGEVTGTTSVLIGGAQNGATYYFKVRAFKASSSGDTYILSNSYSPERKITVNYNQYDSNHGEEKPTVDKVQNLNINSVSKNSTKISWNSVSGASGYDIWMAKGYGSYYYLDTVSYNNATISNLDYNTTYHVKVRAYKLVNGQKYYGDFSSERSFTTENYVADLGRVTGVNVDSIDGNIVNVSWSGLTGASGYNIYLSEGNSNNYTFFGNSTGTWAQLILYPNTKYYIKIAAYDRYGKEGTASIAKTFTTGNRSDGSSGKISLPAPEKVSISVQYLREAKIYWWSVEGADGYKVYLSENGGKDYYEVQDLSTNNTIIYSNVLQYNKTYKLKVQAYKYVNGKKECGEFTKAYSFTTQPADSKVVCDEIPRPTVAAHVDKDTVLVTWGKVDGAVSYEILFGVPGYGESTLCYTTDTSKVISGLTPSSSDWTIRVRAYKNVNGRQLPGPYSYVIGVRPE